MNRLDKLKETFNDINEISINVVFKENKDLFNDLFESVKFVCDNNIISSETKRELDKFCYYRNSNDICYCRFKLSDKYFVSYDLNDNDFTYIGMINSKVNDYIINDNFNKTSYILNFKNYDEYYNFNKDLESFVKKFDIFFKEYVYNKKENNLSVNDIKYNLDIESKLNNKLKEVSRENGR